MRWPGYKYNRKDIANIHGVPEMVSQTVCSKYEIPINLKYPFLEIQDI